MPGDPQWASPCHLASMPRARKAKKYKVNALVTGATEPCSSGPRLAAPLSLTAPQVLPRPSPHPPQRVNSGVFTVTVGAFRGGGPKVSPHRACLACLWRHKLGGGGGGASENCLATVHK